MKNIRARTIGSVSEMPGGGMILRSKVSDGPAGTVDRHVELEIGTIDIKFLLSELAQSPDLWEDTFRGIVRAYDGLDAAEAENPDQRMAGIPVRNWRKHGRHFGPLYHAIKQAVYGS